MMMIRRRRRTKTTTVLTKMTMMTWITMRSKMVRKRHGKRNFTDMRLRTVLLLTALLYIDAAATVSIWNSASRLNRRKAQSLRHHLSDNNVHMKFHPRPILFPEKNPELRYSHPLSKNNPEVPLSHSIPLPENKNAMALHPHSSPLPEGKSTANYPYPIPLPKKNNPDSSFHRPYPFHPQSKPIFTQDLAPTFLVATPLNYPTKGKAIMPETRPYPHTYPHPSPFLNKNKLLPFNYPEVDPSSEQESEVEPSHSPDNVTEMEPYASLEDELEQEGDSSAQDGTEKEMVLFSEKGMQEEPPITAKSPHPSRASCLVGWIYHKELSACYNFFQAKMTWIQAEMSCQMYASGAHLASIHGEGYNQFIQGLIKQKNPIQSSTWIGLSDCHKEGIYLWTDGSLLDFTKWNDNQPNDEAEAENCVNINSEGVGGKWYDRACSDELPFICSYKLF
ncbi:uncharacterized protein LOC121293358 isoform X1 [Carcharodon carcharias]|uniref:uncharacterized protein LOC121293358 isoform X1 n=2 Tax=Carcharodon carcharias TaxID=13397 RepID=UPI001B7F51C7|nr:uncharacterized protein LOC121293358 isoform X1 [Carcharodon carcharias]XP_041072278.1 uncharacterized protein LOC121293358 isoform X1 [Carcharodon carcharias]